MAGAFFAVVFLAAVDVVDFEAGAFFAAVALVAVDFEAVDFAAVVLAGVDFAAVDFEVVAFVADAFFAGAFLAAVDFAAVDFAAVDLAAVDFDVVAFVADAFFAGAFLAVVVLAAVDFAAVRPPGVARLAAEAAVPAAALAVPTATEATARTVGGLGMLAAVSLGSFLAPETTFLRSWPGENFGTDFFFDFIRSPVCGLRTQRALRTAFSNEPNPVMATFSPLATSRVMVSSTESSACAACLRFPS